MTPPESVQSVPVEPLAGARGDITRASTRWRCRPGCACAAGEPNPGRGHGDSNRRPEAIHGGFEEPHWCKRSRNWIRIRLLGLSSVHPFSPLCPPTQRCTLYRISRYGRPGKSDLSRNVHLLFGDVSNSLRAEHFLNYYLFHYLARPPP